MTFIEDRPLNRIEMNLLLAEAPETETRNLVAHLRSANIEAFDLFNQDCCVYKFGLIINQRPVYFAYITNYDGKYELNTVVNDKVREQYSLYKYSKRSLKKALEQFSPIYATMEKHLTRNIKWTEHLGFKKIAEDDTTVTFKIEK